MKKLLLTLLIVASTTSLWAEKQALLVGVSDVRGRNALYTDIDLQTMRQMLKKAGFKIHTLSGEGASLENVRAKFRYFYTLKADDIFVFYYTGHGARMRGVNKNESIDNFFVLNNAYFTDENTVGGGILSDNEYSMHLNKIKAQKISIVDACHSATIYKGLGTNKAVKSMLPTKGGSTVFNRANSIQKFSSYNAHNLINISAAKDRQQAENSPIGSTFTLALSNLIQNYPHITLNSLEKRLNTEVKSLSHKLNRILEKKYPTFPTLTGGFTPKINTAPKKKKYTLKVKDIFVRKRLQPALETRVLAKPKNRLSLITADGSQSYRENQSIKFNIVSKATQGHLYLFEKKGENYTLLGEKTLSKCQSIPIGKYCQFDNIFATKPLGTSIAYAVVTKNALTIEHQSIKKDFEIDEEFFDIEDNLATQIEKEKIAGVKLELEITKK